jgi:serine/threonine protein kinase
MDLVPGLLLDVGKLCGKMRENEDLCRQLHGRATLFWDHVNSMTQDEKIANTTVLLRYKRTLVRIRKTLRKHHDRGLFIRIWGNHRVVSQLQDLMQRLNNLFQLMELDHILAMEEFRRTAEEGFKELRHVAEDLGALRAALQAEGWREGLVAIGMVAQHPTGRNATEEMPDAQAELARSTFTRAESILADTNVALPLIPEWFIARDEVDFDDETVFDRGAYATAHVGTWGEGGHGTEVIVKCLVADDEKAEEEFKRESRVWFGLDHPNVVRMYGACHEGMPIFFVCEYVKGGNFFTLFEHDKSHLWRLFYSAAKGLKYLHKQKVVHGDLKCNNILVVDGDTAKICDFGFSYVRERSNMSERARTKAIQWQAPEVLLPLHDEPEAEVTSRNPRFASDVFSLGRCLIEAFSGEPPYGVADEDEVMASMFEGEPHPRPDGMQDDEWELVGRLCDLNWKTRIPLDEALDTLKFFADRERAVEA